MAQNFAAITWSVDPIRKLDNLRPSKARGVMRKAVRKAATQVRQDLRAAVPVRTGALKRSLAIKVGTTKKDLVVYGVVGPSRKFRGIFLYNSKKGKPVYAYPGFYGWLVNRGTRFFSGHLFLESVWSSGQNKYMETIKAVAGEEYRKILGV